MPNQLERFIRLHISIRMIINPPPTLLPILKIPFKHFPISKKVPSKPIQVKFLKHPRRNASIFSKHSSNPSRLRRLIYFSNISPFLKWQLIHYRLNNPRQNQQRLSRPQRKNFSFIIRQFKRSQIRVPNSVFTTQKARLSPSLQKHHPI